MAANLLVIYEIEIRAAKVKTKEQYQEFEKWVNEIRQTNPDAAIERLTNMQLNRLRAYFIY